MDSWASCFLGANLLILCRTSRGCSSTRARSRPNSRMFLAAFTSLSTTSPLFRTFLQAFASAIFVLSLLPDPSLFRDWLFCSARADFLCA